MNTVYCKFCGNNQVESDPDVRLPCCPDCEARITALGQAGVFFREAIEQYGRCCSGLSGEHLYLHSEGFDSDYEAAGMRVEVEAGVNFHADGATCYWLFDNDSTCHSEEFGDMIPYDAPDFWEKVEKLVGTAAEVAFDSDVLTCEHCGYHYHVGNDDHDDCGEE